MKVTIKQLPALRVAAVRHVGPYDEIPEAFARLGEIAQQHGIFPESDATLVALYYDDPQTTPAEQLRSDAGILVAEDLKLPKGLAEERLPAGRYASAVHVGPYEQLPKAWQRLLGEWLPANGHRPGAGASYELYLNNPHTAKPEDLRTELRVPLA